MNKQSFLITLIAGLLTPVFGVAQQEELGLASFYSDLFNGKPTASGELYNKDGMTAAHKTIPFGTTVRITRLDNGKSVTVKVNDRGPYISGRIVELSRAAADKIDLVRDGTTRVKVEVVSSEEMASSRKIETKAASTKTPEITAKGSEANASKKPEKVEVKSEKAQPKTLTVKTSETKPSSDNSTVSLYEVSMKKEDMKGFGVQVAAFKSEEAMLKKVEELKSNWFDKVLVSLSEDKGEKIYKIILGSFATRSEAEVYKTNLKKNKKMNGFVVDLSAMGN